jgi:divalent metal cation (Fe/Co/Zn/Cd) transporter
LARGQCWKPIHNELGADIEVETHIEPLEVQHLTCQDAPPAVVSEISTSIAEIANTIGAIREVHNVRVRATPTGLIVNYHCRAEPLLDVQSIHEHVDDLERRMRNAHPDIFRVIGHAEPVR